MRVKNVHITLQRRSSAQSATGQPTNVWTEYGTALGSVQSLKGADFYATAGTENEITAELLIHYRSDIEPSDRVLINGEVYEIKGFPENVNMRNRQLKLRVRRVE